MSKFLKSNLSAKEYINDIELLKSLGSKEIIETQSDFFKKNIKVGHIELLGHLNGLSNKYKINPNLIAGFIIYLWNDYFSNIKKEAGIGVDFLNDENFTQIISFTKEGKPNKFLIYIDIRGKDNFEILSNVAHEFIHVNQYIQNNLYVDDKGNVHYLDKVYPFTSANNKEDFYKYLSMQHEQDAYFNEEDIVNNFKIDSSKYIFESKLFKTLKEQIIFDYSNVLINHKIKTYEDYIKRKEEWLKKHKENDTNWW